MSVEALVSRLSALRFEVESDGVAVLTINRPERLNALSADVMAELALCIEFGRVTPHVRALIIMGAGPKSFVAGADISEFRGLDRESGQVFAEQGQAVFSAIEALPKPVIAAVNGFALGGGCELALACHLRICSDSARFGQPEVGLGLLPGYGGTQRLPRAVGASLAAEMMLTGDPIDANRALQAGLVSRVVPLDELLETAKVLARRILERAPLAVAFVLDALRAGDGPLDRGLAREALLFGQACGTADFREGVDAFLARRKPQFEGR